MKQRTSRLAETWGLGHSAEVLFALLALTGMGLMFFYRPDAAWAWTDVVDMHEVSWAGSLRRLHHWGAHVLLIVLWLHMLRTFLLGAHRGPRRVDWKLGVILLALSLALAATGYLLPWDRTAASALELHHPTLGGQGASNPTLEPRSSDSASLSTAVPSSSTENTERGKRLLWIYVLHCLVLPAAAIFFMLCRRYWGRRSAEATS